MTDHTHTNPHNPQTDPDDITETRPAAIDPSVVAATPDTVLLAAWSAGFVAGCVNVALGREIRAQFRAAAARRGPEAIIEVAHHLIDDIWGDPAARYDLIETTRHALVDPQPPGVAPWDTREADQ